MANSFFSHFTNKQFYFVVFLGLAILFFFLLLSISAKVKIESGTLTPDEMNREGLIFAASRIGTTIGFIIALFPSVKIFQHEILRLKTQGKKEDSDEAEPSKTTDSKDAGPVKTDSSESN